MSMKPDGRVKTSAAWLIETAGACLIVAGVHEAWGLDAGLVAAGSALVLKAYELDLRGDK